jgi:hypothetical protein
MNTYIPDTTNNTSSHMAGTVMTVGWDNYVKFWDMRFSNVTPAVTLSVSDTVFARARVSAADASFPFLSVAESVPAVRISTYDIRKYCKQTVCCIFMVLTICRLLKDRSQIMYVRSRFYQIEKV